MTAIDRFTTRAVHRQLSHLEWGDLTIVDPSGERRYGDGTAPHVRLRVHDQRFYRVIALGGHLGAVEAYLDGWWETDDLPSLAQLMVRNRSVLDGLESGGGNLLGVLHRAWHALRRNTRTGSRRNIHAHYDLGNDFFSTFLDESLTYSCGIFERPESTLYDASIAKYDRLCHKLELSARDHVIEIGTGWGGFALHAAERYGCRVTTTTISREQYRHAQGRVAQAALGNRVTVLDRDYRDLRGSFTKLVSIEMVEAVGHEYLHQFFQKCAALLAPGGRMGLQSITIPDEHYNRARREIDFIKRYIFPGSCIPSLERLRTAAARAGLVLVHHEDITSHYAETLRRWRENFVARWERVSALGFSEEFRRLWEFYFAYCEGGFRERFLGDVQLAFGRDKRSAMAAT